MTQRLMIMCSGQGGQHAAMFDLALTDPDGAALLAQANARADPAEMYQNAVAQPAIVAGALALWAALRGRIAAPAMAAGYSIGEVAAWAVAGALSAPDAIALSRIRASAMDAAACATQPQVLVAVSGVPVQRVAASTGFELSIVNGYDACIAGGLEADLARFEVAVAREGGKVQRLPVAVASHTSLMGPAVATFAATLREHHFSAPRCPVLSGIRAVAVREPDAAIQDLSLQLGQTIRWSECMDVAAEAGIDVVLELGPGAALARMMQARHPHITCRSVADFRSIDGVVGWVSRQLGQ